MTLLRKHLTLLILSCLPAVAAAQYPERPITITVPFSPGSISDTATRLVAEKMRETLGQQVIVENKPGAAGMIGAGQIARSAPDGYAILLGSNSTNAINKSLYKKMTYDLERDFAPISMAGEIPAVIIARNDLGVSDIKELISYDKAHPNQLTFANGNTTNQISGLTLNKMGGLKMMNVPYKAEPEGMLAVLSGQVDVMFLNLPVAYPHIKSGKVKALAFPGASKVEALPAVPLASDSVPGYTIPNGWLAFFAPAGTPAGIVEKLNGAIVSALADPDVKNKLESSGGYIVRSSTPAELSALVKHDVAKWAELIKAANVPMM